MIRKVCFVITARASYARIKTVLTAIHQQEQLELMIVLSASASSNEYGNLEKQIQSDRLPITAKVNCLCNVGKLTYPPVTTGIAIIKLSKLFEKLKPDVVVTIADRFETISTAIAAAYMNIPLAHIQGGEVTGNIDEKVRHAVTKLADLHFVATENARQRLIKMGEEPCHVHLTGCPSIDLALSVDKHFPRPDFPLLMLNKPYLMVLQHPVTTETQFAGDHFEAALAAVRAFDMPVLWFLPNADHGRLELLYRIDAIRRDHSAGNVCFLNNLPPEQFIHLLRHTACLIGNSSAGIREASVLGIPAVNIGNRQTGRDRGQNVLDVAHDQAQIQNAILRQLARGHYLPDHLYGTGGAGQHIARLLATLPLTFEKKITY